MIPAARMDVLRPLRAPAQILIRAISRRRRVALMMMAHPCPDGFANLRFCLRTGFPDARMNTSFPVQGALVNAQHANPLAAALADVAARTGACMVLLGEFLASPLPRIRTLCCLQHGEIIDNFSFRTTGDPADALSEHDPLVVPERVRELFPASLFQRDLRTEAYVARIVPLDSEHRGMVALLWKTPQPDAASHLPLLEDLVSRFGSQAGAIPLEVERERARYGSFVHDEFFREFVLDNQEAFHFAEYMPPVPLDLPEEELLERLMHTAHVIESNRAMAHFYGYPDIAAYMGITPYDANGPERAPRMIKYWKENNYCLRDVESQSVDADGNIVWVRGTVVGLIAHGKLTYCWAHRRDVTTQRRYETAIEHRAQHDALTGLPNRYWFQSHLADLIQDSRYRQVQFCLGLLDLNRFKEINDTLGHVVGDQILEAVAKRLVKGLRPHDAAIARLGGDEFAILIPEVNRLERCEAMAFALEQLLAKPFAVEDMQISIGGALGLALYPTHSDNGDDLLRMADVAMYAAKRAGRSFDWYRPELDHHSRRRLSLLTSLGPAIEKGELFLMYQPKIDLRAGGIAGTEALVRWNHPSLGLIPPSDFIPFAETGEVIRPLTRWVLAESIRQAAVWQAEGLGITLSVNISVRNLLDDQLGPFIRDCLAMHGLPPSAIELEVTESALMTQPSQSTEILHTLCSLGLTVAIDDFGTGYSSLAYLARLPVNTLKVDQSFVRDMLRSPIDAQIVRAIIGLAHQSRLDVVAEGVEDSETLAALTAMGCDYAQGFHIARPMLPEDARSWLRARATGSRLTV